MDRDLNLEIFEGITIDSITGKTTEKSVYIKSGMRNVYISINTIIKLYDFLIEKGIVKK